MISHSEPIAEGQQKVLLERSQLPVGFRAVGRTTLKRRNTLKKEALGGFPVEALAVGPMRPALAGRDTHRCQGGARKGVL